MTQVERPPGTGLYRRSMGIVHEEDAHLVGQGDEAEATGIAGTLADMLGNLMCLLCRTGPS